MKWLLKSIRWQLQLWYGLILVLVLFGFGFTAYQLERGRQFRRFDDQLQRRIAPLLNTLRPTPIRDRGPIDRGPIDRPPADRQRERRPGQDQWPQGPGQNDGPRGPFNRQPASFDRSRLPPLFDETDANAFYYVIWTRDRRELARSTNAPTGLLITPNTRAPAQPEPRMRDNFRELIHFTRPGDIVLVGRSIQPELTELRRAALKLAFAGSIILLFGLAGGWWIATRAIRPINNISATAVKIAGGDLSQRINSSDTESELGRLVTVLNSTFARLEAAFAQQQQFTSDAAHELRTPVSVLLTQTQATLKRQRSPEEYREAIEACERAAERMRQLIESLLKLARFDAGQETMKRLPFDLAETVRDSAGLVQPLAEQRNIQMHHDLPSLQCVGDREHMSQVITNLLTNAIHYNKDGGQIRISGSAQNGTALLTISDTGQGIAASDLPHVFERFYRADSSRSSSHAGLGLAICKAIIEAHGGTIEVSSQPDVGTSFSIHLPSP